MFKKRICIPYKTLKDSGKTIEQVAKDMGKSHILDDWALRAYFIW